MALFLEDLADETSSSNHRTAERLEAEAGLLLASCQAPRDDLRRQITEAARYSTDLFLFRLAQAEGFWRSALPVLRSQPDGGIQLLRRLLSVFQSGQRLARSLGELGELAERHALALDRADQVESASRRFDELACDANSALEHREKGWQPADPERFAKGLEEAIARISVPAREAAARFRRASE